MEFIPTVNTVEVQLTMRLDGQHIENTLSFQRDDGWDAEGMEALAEYLFSWWDEHIAPQLSQELSLVGCIITDQTSDTAPSLTFTPSSPLAGEREQPSEPNNVCICVSFRSAARGRSSRGRNYVSGLGVSDVTGNEFDQNLLDNLVDGYSFLISDPIDLTTDWVIISRFTGGSPRTEGYIYQVQSVVAVDNTIDSQRRRLPGRGA